MVETEWSCRGSLSQRLAGRRTGGRTACFGVCVCVWFFQVGRRAEAGGGWVRETCWEGGSPGGEAVTPPSALLPSVEFPESEDSVTTMFSVERRNYGGARAGWLPSPQACRR